MRKSVPLEPSFFDRHIRQSWFALLLQTVIILSSGLIVMYGTVGKIDAKFDMLSKQVDKVESVMMDHIMASQRGR